MESTVVVALISGLCVAVPNMIATISTSKRNNDLVLYRINELSERVEKHNNFDTRIHKLEQARAVHEEEFHNLSERVGKLEN